jgi:hypothetical protein
MGLYSESEKRERETATERIETVSDWSSIINHTITIRTTMLSPKRMMTPKEFGALVKGLKTDDEKIAVLQRDIELISDRDGDHQGGAHEIPWVAYLNPDYWRQNDRIDFLLVLTEPGYPDLGELLKGRSLHDGHGDLGFKFTLEPGMFNVLFLVFPFLATVLR